MSERAFIAFARRPATLGRMQCFDAERLFPYRAQLGEGALWDVETERLLWVDICDHKVCCFDPTSGANLSFDVGQDIGTVVVTRSGQWLVALRTGLFLLETATGRLTRVAEDPEREHTQHRFNDGKCDPEGRLWVGTMVESGPQEQAALYRWQLASPAGLRPTPILKGVSLSNGLCWFEDRFYHIDTPTQQVAAYDYEPESGRLSGRRTVAEIPKALGAPDGMTVDVSGQLWVALWGGGKVIRINPEDGAIGAEVRVPAKNITSCTFGGKNLDQLFITTARVDMSAEELERSPAAGSLFVAQVGTHGLPSTRLAVF